MSCISDTTVDEIELEDVDSLLLTGCMDIMSLINEERIFDFIKRVATKDAVIASISSSPILLAKAGVLKGKRYTVGITEENMERLGVFEKENYSEE